MSSQSTPEQAARVRELTQAVYHDQASADEKTELCQLIEDSREAAWIYAQYMHLFAALHWDKSQPLMPTPQPTVARSITSNQSPILESLAGVFNATAGFFSRSFVLTLLLAIGLPGMVLLLLMVDISRQPVATMPRATQVAPMPPVGQMATVAKVTQEYACVWDQTTSVFPVGTRLNSGQELQLREGLVELTYNNGAKVLLEGPSTFRINNQKEGFLCVGCLVAKAPKGAEGFTITTPSAKIVDLGTEFGVSVLGDGTAEAHVFQGEIEVATRPAAKQIPPTTKRFVAGQAVKVSPEKTPQLVDMPAAGIKFVRHIPGTLAEPTIIFAHHGSKDPATEGWKRYESKKKTAVEIGPVNDNGTAAWSFHSTQDYQFVYYVIKESEGLDPKLISEANQKGWVMRARIWISDQSKGPKGRHPKGSFHGLCHFHYSNGEQSWILHPAMSSQGDQVLILCGKSSLGESGASRNVLVPGSRNKYVDYEFRYHPDTKSVDVFVNGRCVATRFTNYKDKITPRLRFGMWRFPSETRYALFEWGILREKPNTQADTTGPDHEE